jgi:hypothetical protein
MTAMMEQMLRDPNMQKMLYPYLPEAMRNPESIEWMLNNPEVRKQMESVFANSVSAYKVYCAERGAVKPFWEGAGKWNGSVQQ